MHLNLHQFVTGIFRVLRNTSLTIFPGVQDSLFQMCECHTKEELAVRCCVHKYASVVFRTSKCYLIYIMSFNSLQGPPQFLAESILQGRQTDEVHDVLWFLAACGSQGDTNIAVRVHRLWQLLKQTTVHMPLQSFMWWDSTTHPIIISIWSLVNITRIFST